MTLERTPQKQKAGGARGGKQRWKKISPEERSKIMRRVARARWGPKKKVKKKNVNASQLAKQRWLNTSPEERRNVMKRVREGRSVTRDTK